MVWYNENDPEIVAWLKELRAEGIVPNGIIDERSIEDVKPSDCAETSHFFAGIGGWAYALELAGWPPDAPVWTGSCPCQPFSQAGKRGGFDDPRHLWPIWKKLIKKCRPSTIFGEQVAGNAGLEWLARVRSDLEAMGYAVGSADLCAASVGAPGIRQRLWWVADTKSDGWRRRGNGNQAGGRRPIQTPRSGTSGGMGDTNRKGLSSRKQTTEAARHRRSIIANGDACGMGHANKQGSQRRCDNTTKYSDQCAFGPTSPWSEFDLIPCADGKARRIESGSFPLAHGIPARVVRLRGYGNAIVPQVAAVFIKAFMSCE